MDEAKALYQKCAKKRGLGVAMSNGRPTCAGLVCLSMCGHGSGNGTHPC